MSILIEDIEDEFLNQITETGLFKTVGILEPDILESDLEKLLGIAPCCYLLTLDEIPLESGRMQDGSSTILEQRFMMLVGSSSLRNKKEKLRGCYSLTRELRTLFEGNTFTVNGESTQNIVWYGRQYWGGSKNMAWYSVTFGIHSI